MKCKTILSNDGNRLICTICKSEKQIAYPLSADDFFKLVNDFDTEHRDCVLINSCADSTTRKPEATP